MPYLAPDKQLLTVVIARKMVDELRDKARDEETTMAALVRQFIRDALKAARQE